ncbi:endonuclease/exonuclease/phosphatase [Hirsutella rhossiliensis]
MQAKRATRDECIAEPATFQARATTLRLLLNEHTRVRQIPERVGKHSKRIDKALPGKHTRKMYDELTRKESEVLVQLRTGKSRLNGYLCKIGAEESDECTCGQSAETVEHFLFRCRRWTVQREIMLRYARGKMGNLSFFLGGKAESDDDKWQPDMGAVRATIQFALATKRFSMDRRGTMY